MREFKPPQEYKYVWNRMGVFLAGGILGCPNWRKDLIELLKDEDIDILNPQREDFPESDPNAKREQIEWEFNHLIKADLISFWFSRGTVNPTTRFELGRWLVTDTPIVIGIDPDYSKIEGTLIQIELERPDIKVVHSLKELAEQIKEACM